jgi:hypothetical protein
MENKPQSDSPSRWQPKVGRNTKLTPELMYKLAAHIASGQYVETACGLCGVTSASFRSWTRKAKEIEERLGENEPATGEEELFLSFLSALTSARAESVARSVANIKAAGKSDWRAEAWYLERTEPALFGSVERHVHEFGKSSDEQLVAETARLLGGDLAQALGKALGTRSGETETEDQERG